MIVVGLVGFHSSDHAGDDDVEYASPVKQV